MTGRLILVKHARPVITPGDPPSTWPLSEDGRLAAAALARRLTPYEPARLVASPHAKALATAEAMGEVLRLPVTTDARLVEQRSETTPFLNTAEFEALVERMLLRPDDLILGEETGAAARERFAAAAEPLQGGGATSVVVAHGRVITLWVCGKSGLDPMTFWRRLSLPSAVVMDSAGEVIETVLA